ncbi:PREDICTED: adenylate kinase isoenzyme 1-like [Priapulus caudatus]|uniref:Adenylate kinase isoenzyme 1-like n=1 Tax=Priapulus caudatus TaxID=37621 RepID=A0ABM1ERY7_PRICU|nr:PREDICTED: adenylate kinase isoenzyme 1-like [Priapulus caudatus]
MSANENAEVTSSGDVGIDVSVLKEGNLVIIFVVGGPGSGKGTQCAKIVEKYGFTQLSAGDLLRAEVASGSERSKEFNEVMEKGELLPMSAVLELLKEAMVAKAADTNGFVMDGYPREIIQGVEFEKQVKDCSFVLYFELAEEVMKERLMKRAATSDRVDDNEETMLKRLRTFSDVTMPVIDHYRDKLKTISAAGTIEEVFEETCKTLDECLPS